MRSNKLISIPIQWVLVAVIFLLMSLLLSCSDSGDSGGSDETSDSLYTVTYSAESATSGTVPVDSNTYAEGIHVTILDNTGNLEKAGWLFANWSDTEDCSGTQHYPHYQFIMPAADVTLYACWHDISKIIASDAAENDSFGRSVAIDGDYVIIGASEKAYVFNRTGDNVWDSGYKLVASDATSDIDFGYSVNISGNYAVVGASATDDGKGAVYLYERTGTNTWGSETKLSAPDDGAKSFGSAVAIDGDYIIVGAPAHISASTAGAAYVYQRSSGNNWGSEAKLNGTGTDRFDEFGHAVAISGDYAIVGAYYDDSVAFGVGAAYMFHRTGGNSWSEEYKIVPSDTVQAYSFGNSVAINGDYAAVGSNNARPDSTIQAGAVYVFSRNGTDWSEVSILTAAEIRSSENFGFSVSMDADSIAIATTSRAYHISELSSGSWGEPIRTDRPETSAAYFGHTVAIDGDYAVIGAPNTDISDDSNAGVVYIYPQN